MIKAILDSEENELEEMKKEKRMKIAWSCLLVVSFGVALYFLLIKGWQAMTGGFLIAAVVSYWIMFVLSFFIAPQTVEQEVFMEKNDVPFVFGGVIMFLVSCAIVIMGIMLITVPYQK